jgi:hypothetical protein
MLYAFVGIESRWCCRPGFMLATKPSCSPDIASSAANATTMVALLL